ncbi:MAG: hypothetical protein K6E76_00595 [Patescibacteria group bacterium]|nr:hypothetical protein [Patescibacteria group bacterium]
MGGSGNVINANTGIIMGGQENKITNAKAIIFGSHNEVTGKVSQSTDLENVILGNHIKLTNEGS